MKQAWKKDHEEGSGFDKWNAKANQDTSEPSAYLKVPPPHRLPIKLECGNGPGGSFISRKCCSLKTATVRNY